MKENNKLTALERSWILYDVGNSAFSMMISTLIPIFFNALAESAGVHEDLYLSYWGYAGSIATILVAIIGPVCGAIADRKNKRGIFLACMLIGVAGCALLGTMGGWISFLAMFILDAHASCVRPSLSRSLSASNSSTVIRTFSVAAVSSGEKLR